MLSIFVVIAFCRLFIDPVTPERLTENQQKILHCIEQNPHISAREMAISVGISSRKIEDNLKKLKENGILERVGVSKGGFWRLINKEI
jgi:predicted HTH transcriptional regulator